MKQNNSLKGFTLIELIITISILAVLVAIVVVALNPSEQLKRARDTKRVSDLDSMKTGINLYLAQATATINLSGDTTANGRCVGGTNADTIFFNTTGAGLATGGLVASSTGIGQKIATSSAAQVTSTSSWMPALLGQTPGGAPIAQLALDPTNGVGNSASFFYAYTCSTPANTYEFTARLESTYFADDLALNGTDGGNSSSTYEVGTDLTLIGNAY